MHDNQSYTIYLKILVKIQTIILIFLSTAIKIGLVHLGYLSGCFIIIFGPPMGCVEPTTLSTGQEGQRFSPEDYLFANALILESLDQKNIDLHNQSSAASNMTAQLKPPPISSSSQQFTFQQKQTISQNQAQMPKIMHKSSSNPKQDKQELLKNVQKLDFKNPNPAYCGAVKILNQSAHSIISNSSFSLMVASNYGSGRAVCFGDQCLFKMDYLGKGKNWVFLLRNIVKWVAKCQNNSVGQPLKIACIGIMPFGQMRILLARAGLHTQITFISQLSQVNLSGFQVILIGDISFQQFSSEDCQSVINFVQNGGGVASTLRGWVFKNYGEGKTCKDWRSQCLQNRIFRPMGMQFDENYLTLSQLAFNPSQKMQLKQEILKKYVRKSTQQSNQQATQSQPVQTNDKFSIDRQQITNGVENIEYGGACFSSFLYPETSFFPIVSIQNKTYIGGGYYGKGKIFLFGHTALFQQDKADNRKLVHNVISWLCPNKDSYNIGLLFDGQWQNTRIIDQLEGNLSRIYTPQQLSDKDVVAISYYPDWPSDLTDQMLKQLKNYVKNGGNLIFSLHGWVWGMYGGGAKDKNAKYQQSYAGLRILKLFDLYIQTDYAKLGSPCRIEQTNVSTKNLSMQNFLKNDLMKVLKGSTSFSTSTAQINSYISKIQQSKNFSTICSIDLYHQIVDAFVDSSFNIQKNYNKLKSNNEFSNNVYKILNALSYACPPQECRALPPSLNKYPGCAVKKLDKKVIQIYKNKNQVCHTGLYINPGEAIKIKHSHSLEETVDVSIVINQNLSLYGYDNGPMRRYPDISKRFTIKTGEFSIATPHGGTIFFSVRSKSNMSKPLTFEFYGAYQAPYFNESIHSQSDFDRIKLIQAPFFVFETNRVILSGPTKQMFNCLNTNVSKLCKYWNTVIGIYKQFRDRQAYPFQKDSIFNDINTKLGYMHSGTPIMTQQDVTFEFLGCGKDIIKQGNWGIYHEFGHNHQDYKWTTSGTVQVTNNIYSLYLFWKMHGVPAFQSSWLMKDPNEVATKYKKHMALAQSNKMKNYNEDPQLGLYLYAILIDEFGFQIFSTLHKNYDKLNIRPDTDQAKYQMLVQQLSLVIGKNMWNYFKNWGMPVTDKSKNKVSNLAKYECKRHPELSR